MTERLYLTPWSPHEHATAERLELHCALCRASDVPYHTRPEALLAPNPEAMEHARAAVAKLPGMFGWKPKDAHPVAEDPFRAVLDGSADHVAVWGGRGSGKSHRAADAIVEAASVGKERVAGAREYMTRIKESSKELLENKIQASKWADDWDLLEYELRNRRTGSVIFFVGLAGHNAESAGKALEGITILWTDEAQLLSQRSLDIILPTIRAAGSRCLWTWNPHPEGDGPIDMFRGPNPPERSKVACLLVEDNPYLYATRLASELRSSFARDTADKFRHIWRGANLEITDATIFRDLSQGFLDASKLTCGGEDMIEWTGADHTSGGADPAVVITGYFIPATSVPGYAPENGTKPIIYIRGEAYENGIPNHELPRLAREALASPNVTIVGDSASPNCNTALSNGGFHTIGMEKHKEPVNDGINRLSSCAIIVSPNCPRVYGELKGLHWKTDPRTGKIVTPHKHTGDDHGPDAVRYGTSIINFNMTGNGVDYV